MQTVVIHVTHANIYESVTMLPQRVGTIFFWDS